MNLKVSASYLEKQFRETSQNFNSIKQPIGKLEITIVWMSWMSWNFVRFRENEKVLFLKKRFQAEVSECAKIDPKNGACCPNFQWRFWSCLPGPTINSETKVYIEFRAGHNIWRNFGVTNKKSWAILKKFDYLMIKLAKNQFCLVPINFFSL